MKEGEGLESTVSFLMSERGVKQALLMAKDELQMIKEDQFGSDIWGEEAGAEMLGADAKQVMQVDGADASNDEEEQQLKMLFLFAKTDHWVANTTRDEILKAFSPVIAYPRRPGSTYELPPARDIHLPETDPSTVWVIGSNKVDDNLPSVLALFEPSAPNRNFSKRLGTSATIARTLDIGKDVATCSLLSHIVCKCSDRQRPQVTAGCRTQGATEFDDRCREPHWLH